MQKRVRTVVAAAVLLGACGAWGADALMGDWQGTWDRLEAGKKAPLAAQVIAEGDGRYKVQFLHELDKRAPHVIVLKGTAKEGVLSCLGGKEVDKTPAGGYMEQSWAATFKEGKATVHVNVLKLPSKQAAVAPQRFRMGPYELKKVVRLSPTLGAKPPEGAVVLFDGTSLDQFTDRGGKPIRWKLLKDEKAMEVRGGGLISKHKFTDHKLHVEFRTPYKPKARGQGRGNSGVYLQARYEVQILDSYGLEGRDNECGGIYSVGPPRVNMCAPPLQWQTYDITFHAPRFDADGKKVKEARMTVLHNGVMIHENQDVPHPTTACWDRNVRVPGGLHLQDHGNPVQFRNIWAVELKPAADKTK